MGCFAVEFGDVYGVCESIPRRKDKCDGASACVDDGWLQVCDISTFDAIIHLIGAWVVIFLGDEVAPIAEFNADAPGVEVNAPGRVGVRGVATEIEGDVLLIDTVW